MKPNPIRLCGAEHGRRVLYKRYVIVILVESIVKVILEGQALLFQWKCHVSREDEVGELPFYS